MRASMRATEKYIALFILAVSFSALSLSAQTAVVTNPTMSQGITQPTGTGFSIGENNTSGGAPTLFGVGLTDTSDGSSPTLVNQSLNCFGQGYSFGNNGTSAQGWAGCYLQSSSLFSSASGIDHVRSDSYTHSAQGDTALQYSYLTTFGGATAASDEGITPMVIHSNQMGYMNGSLDSTATTGAIEILITGGIGCNGYCATFADVGKKTFAQGGILFDKTRPAGTATLSGSTYDTTLSNIYYTLGSGSVAVSSAWGNIVLKDGTNPYPCDYSAFDQWQDSKTATCKVVLGAGSADFGTGADICLAGPFQEEAAITSAPASVGGVQYISFLTRYAWDSPVVAPLVMQGGVCGQSIIATSTVDSWPIAYALVGATSATQLYFSNCSGGYCNRGGTILSTPSDVTFYPSAFITGTLNGLLDGANLGVNTVPFQPGDNVVGAPTSEFTQGGINLYLGQASPTYGSTGITVDDAGPYPLTQDIFVNNHAGITPTMMTIAGAFDETFHMDHRPSNGGAIIYNNGVYTTPPTGPYTIYADGNDLGYGVLPATYGGEFSFDPTTGGFSFYSNGPGGLMVGTQQVCVQGGPCATSGSGTVTSVGLSLPLYTVTGSPVTTSGTLTGALVSQTANTVLAAPDGTDGVPSFRALNATDINLPHILAADPYDITQGDCMNGILYQENTDHTLSEDGIFNCDPFLSDQGSGQFTLWQDLGQANPGVSFYSNDSVSPGSNSSEIDLANSTNYGTTVQIVGDDGSGNGNINLVTQSPSTYNIATLGFNGVSGGSLFLNETEPRVLCITGCNVFIDSGVSPVPAGTGVIIQGGEGGSIAIPNGTADFYSATISSLVADSVASGTYQETPTTPSSSSAPCITGQFTDDANYHYVCVATNTWKRVALSSW